MQVMNTKDGPMTIAGAYVIAPNSLRTFDDALWSELRQRKAVAFWLERGDLKEVSGDAAPTPEVQVSIRVEGAAHGVTIGEDGVGASVDPAPAPKRRKGSGTGGAAG